MDPPGGVRHRWENREVEWAGAHESMRATSEFQSEMSDKPAGAFTLGGARGNAARKRLPSINFPPMPDREEMNPVLLHVESVNDPMLANTSSKTIRSF
jgi:hypothetical protein